MFWKRLRAAVTGKPPAAPDRTIKDRSTRGQRDWLDRVAREARSTRVVVTPRFVEYHLAELDALDQQDTF